MSNGPDGGRAATGGFASATPDTGAGRALASVGAYRPIRGLVTIHLVLVVGALIALTFWPPRSGPMILIPLAGGDIDGMAQIGLRAGATLLGRGPIPGSLVVDGDRARIWARLAFPDAVVLAAPQALCGSGVVGVAA